MLREIENEGEEFKFSAEDNRIQIESSKVIASDDALTALLSGMQEIISEVKEIKTRQSEFEKAISVSAKKKSKSVKEYEVESDTEIPKLSRFLDDGSSGGSSTSDDSDSEDEEDDPAKDLRKLLGTEFKHVNPLRGSKHYRKKDKKKKSSERESMLFSDVKRGDTMYSGARDNNMLRMQPNFDHIKLERLNIPAVIRFFRDLSEYQEKYGISLKAGTLIDKKVIAQMLADNHIHYWDHHTFYQLSRTDLYKLLQNALKPTTVKAFEQHLVDYLDFYVPSSYTASATNFKPLYRALINYRTEFMHLYEFMAWKNKAHVPLCTNKPGGLIKIFVSKIVPSSLGENIIQSMKKLSEYSNIEDFLEGFYKVVQSAYKKAQGAKDLGHLLGTQSSYAPASTTPASAVLL